MINNSVKPLILIVDDVPDNLAVLHHLLREKYRVRIAKDGFRALELAEMLPCPDLIVLDVMMPELDGFEVCRRLKKNPKTAAIPVIFHSASHRVEDEELGLELGAVDYLAKPMAPALILARIASQISLQEANARLQNSNALLAENVREKTAELARMQDALIMTMGLMAEARDSDAARHIKVTQQIALLLAKRMQEKGMHRQLLSDEYLTALFKTIPLHDVGKLGLPDQVLFKQGKLDQNEYALMRQHPQLGLEIILSVEEFLGKPHLFLRIAKELAYSHQERWDGQGYPQGLIADEIPVSARLMAIADAYDGLTRSRHYETLRSHREAMLLLAEGAGTQFDPAMVAVALEISEAIEMAVSCIRSQAAKSMLSSHQAA